MLIVPGGGPACRGKHFFNIFWYKIGNWTSTGVRHCVNNERTSIRKMVVLYFFTLTPMMNIDHVRKKTRETTII
jgi:hypothetical protein